MTILEKLEAVQTVQDAVDAFRLIAEEIAVPDDFPMFVSQAASTGLKRADRAWGYLLLAAFTLVPEGWNICLVYHHTYGWSASLGLMGKPETDVKSWYKDTPALALCIAALKAGET